MNIDHLAKTTKSTKLAIREKLVGVSEVIGWLLGDEGLIEAEISQRSGSR